MSSSETSRLLQGSSSSSVLHDQLKKSQGDDGKLQKGEFNLLVLARGINIKQSVLDDIFAQCDRDGDGSLTVDEIFAYIDNAKPKTCCDGVNYAIHKCVTSIVWWFSVVFHYSAWITLFGYILSHFFDHTMKPEWSIVGKVGFFFGAVYFLKALIDGAASKYDTTIQAKKILKHSVEKDPAFFNEKARGDSLDKHELNVAFEEHNMYLPKSTLTQIFAEIDEDKSGQITENEILAFAKNQNVNPTAGERNAVITGTIVKSSGFYSLVCWFIGSVLFLVASLLTYYGYTIESKGGTLPDNTFTDLYGIGAILYFLLAILMLPNLKAQAVDYIESTSEIKRAFDERSKREGLASDEELFQSLDFRRSQTSGSTVSDQESDGNLDPSELYNAMIDSGILIPHDMFLELFNDADESGDGELQLQEFVKFIKKFELIDTNDGYGYALRMAKQSPFCPAFFGTFLFFLGGLFFVVACYFDTGNASTWDLIGGLCYFLSSFRDVFATIKNHFVHFRAVEAAKFRFIEQCTSDAGREVV